MSIRRVALNPAEDELGDLLARLARLFTEHEGSISVHQVVQSLRVLSGSQISALYRLVFLLNKRQKDARQERRRRQPRSRHGKSVCLQSQIVDHESALPPQDEHTTTCVTTDSDRRQQHDRDAVPATDQRCDQIDVTLPVTPPVTGCIALYANCDVDDDTTEPSYPPLTGDIQFAPSTKRLLESCKSDPTRFLDTIRNANVALPTGQGWEAAIAVKNENTDIRDLMRIYHRFECYNIYCHVVKAGFHTGTHWVRDMRSALVDRLRQMFPARFTHGEAAKKCLTWVDQGCKYREWASSFSTTSNLGYLIALPSNIPHSAYTSRCTKEKMCAAATELINSGIHDLVESLELSKLANHLVTELQELTGKDRSDSSGDSPRHVSESQSSGSCSLPQDDSSQISTPTSLPSLNSPVSGSQPMTPVSEFLRTNSDIPQDQLPICAAAHQNLPSPTFETMATNLASVHTENDTWQDQHAAGSALNDFRVLFDPITDFEMTLPPTSLELPGTQYSGRVLRTST